MVKRFILLFLCLAPAVFLSGQADSLLLSEARQQAVARSPILQGTPLLRQLEALQLESVRGDRLPTISLQVEGNIQSETVQFPDDLPLPIPIDLNLPLYGVRSYIDIRYLAWDGGLAAAREETIRSQTATRSQELVVQADKLKEQVDGLFLNILLLQKQQAILDLSLADLQERKASLRSRVQNGVVLPAELSRLEVRELEIRARTAELAAKTEGLREMLSYLCGQEVTDQTSLILPDLTEPVANPAPENPELALFDLQRQQIASQSGLIDARRKPKVALFAKAGAGYPNPLNLFDASLSPYALGGVSFSWQIFDWGQADRDREQLQVQQLLVSQQEEQFRWMLDAGTDKYRTEVTRLQEQLELDDQITALQNDILQQLNAQLDNGVITAAEYITQLNARQQAELNQELHHIQLIQLHVDYYRSRGLNWK